MYIALLWAEKQLRPSAAWNLGRARREGSPSDKCRLPERSCEGGVEEATKGFVRPRYMHKVDGVQMAEDLVVVSISEKVKNAPPTSSKMSMCICGNRPRSCSACFVCGF
jgi:hypothetical protein